MKNLKKLLSLALAATMIMSTLVFSASAETVAPDDPTPTPAATLETGSSENTIPVTISAEATVFNVDVPTSFPSAVDPETGETLTSDDATITNNSYGAIVVTNITAKDNAAVKSGTATWHLADFDKDMSQVKVDSNLIGISVAAKNGKTGSAASTALKTTDANSATQVLLDNSSQDKAEWVINGKTAEDNSNKLTIVYDTNVSPVSETIINEVAAQIVITIAWYKVTTD